MKIDLPTTRAAEDELTTKEGKCPRHSKPTGNTRPGASSIGATRKKAVKRIVVYDCTNPRRQIDSSAFQYLL